MQISVIIVTWNCAEYIDQCISSIQQHTKGIDYEIIVVDNASQDATVQRIQEKHSDVTLIVNNTNLGFGTACNRGAEMATGETLLFLNPDTRFTEDSLEKIVHYMEQHPKMGVLGCHLLFPDGSHQDSVRAYPRLSDQLIILTKLHNFFPHLASIQRYLAQDTEYSREQEVEQVMGAMMAIPQQVFRAAGGFDEHFFVWYEEVDLQKRIHEQQGLKVIYSPITEIIHEKGKAFGRVLPLTSQRRLNASMRYYFRKHHGWVQAGVIAAVQPLSIALSLGVMLYRTLFHTDIKSLKRGQN